MPRTTILSVVKLAMKLFTNTHVYFYECEVFGLFLVRFFFQKIYD